MGDAPRSTGSVVSIRRSVLPFCLTLGTAFFLTGCATSLYLAKLGRGQAKILLNSRSVETVLKDPATEESIKDKIKLVIEAKKYGEKVIGLAETSSFQKFYHVEGSSLLYVVTASPKDRLEPYQWWFPITGRVTTKGFFSREDALREGERLERKGLDVFVQGAQAYSTLGWFKDPIFSTTLRYEPAVVVHVVLHELTHSTIFFKDQFDFNEQIAYFVGAQGAVDFMGTKYGVGSAIQKRAIGLLEDGIVFSRFMRGLFRELKELYARPLSPKVKLENREVLFLKAKERFRALKKSLKTDLYLGFEAVKLNNAAVLAFARYVADIEQIERVYERLDKNLRKTVAFLEEIEKSGVTDPQTFLARWLKVAELKRSISDGHAMSVRRSGFPVREKRAELIQLVVRDLDE